MRILLPLIVISAVTLSSVALADDYKTIEANYDIRDGDVIANVIVRIELPKRRFGFGRQPEYTQAMVRAIITNSSSSPRFIKGFTLAFFDEDDFKLFEADLTHNKHFTRLSSGAGTMVDANSDIQIYESFSFPTEHLDKFHEMRLRTSSGSRFRGR